MALANTLLAEFNQESKSFEKFLDQIPADQLNWQPHPKSMTTGQLALHIAKIPTAILGMVEQDEVPAPDFSEPFPQPESLTEIKNAFRDSIAAINEKLPSFTDESLSQTWRMTKDNQEVLAAPRAAVIRSFLLNHWYHHRGQLGVYLRLLNAKVPSSYGPSGDELPAWAQQPQQTVPASS